MHALLRTVSALALGAAAAAAATGAVAQPPGPAAAAALPALRTAPAPARTLAPPVRFDRFIVHYRASADGRPGPAAVRRLVGAAAVEAGLAGAGSGGIAVRHLRRTALGSDVVASSRPLDAAEAERLLARLRLDPQVAYAQPDYLKTPAAGEPDDPRYPDLQWDLHHPVGGVGAPAAWDTSTGEGVVVAVIDTGYVEHADLSANLVPGYDFISWYGQQIDGEVYPDIAGDGDGRDADARDPGDWTDASMSGWCGAIADSSWHGSHVAGTVAAVADNGLGIAGLAYGARVQPVRVMGHCGGLTSDIVDAIVWASGGSVDGVPANPTPAEVLNLSLGSNNPCSLDPATQAAIDDALGRGVSVVVAAGNAGQNAANHSPASCAGVIAVAATDVAGAGAYYTNYGASVTLSAPGGGALPEDTGWIWSTGNAGRTSPEPSPAGDVLIGMVGTSMAAPHVAAVAAMVQSAAVANGHPPLAPAEMKALLKGTAKPFGQPPASNRPIGTGIVDAAAATAAAARGFDEEDLAVVLVNRVAATGGSGEAAEDLLFKVTVPAGARSLTLRTQGGVGNVDLYAAHGRMATSADHDRASRNPGNSESMTIAAPAAGTWYLRLSSAVPYRGVSTLAVIQ
ncbi:S8 family serine peptidase [Luteimonas sp. RD2P54]|uniref:S8 family serine peptidase n=1 Tax=Luteimonas endophytica TaxID=3042023 RepID=A0ABT6JCD3_9GAMM|nr:S8 family serine peptidase [Luteimonas endophytica]MDH5824486.1 S8 family serine peptidase [Luteimonas endophytica]